MSDDPSIPDRLRAAAPGLGAGSREEIEQRATELAMIDGRDEFTDADLSRAAAELAGGTSEPIAPEVNAAAVAELTTWDEPLDEDGGKVEVTALEDEGNVAQQLMQQGIEEADHDRRVSAAEEASDEVE